MTKTLELVEEHDAELVEVDAHIAFSIKREILTAYLSRILPVLPNKETIPGSSLVHLTAHEAKSNSLAFVSFYATNGEQQVLFDVDGPRVIRAGSVSVPAKRLLEVARLAPKKWVHLQAVGGVLYVRSGNVRWNIQVDSSKKTPTFIRNDEIYPIDIPRWSFLDALKIVLKASPENTARESLQQVQIKDGYATVCDGSRLHRKQISEFPAKTDFNLQIPSARLLVKALENSDSELITLEMSKTAMLFDIGTEKFITQRSILPFPKVDGLFIAPALRNEHTLTVERADLVDSINRVKINSDPASATVSLSVVQVDHNVFNLKVAARDLGGNSSEDIIECQWFGPDKFAPMFFHYKKLLDLLQTTTDEFVFLKLGDDPAKGQKSPMYMNEPEDGLTVVLQQKPAIYM